MGDPLDEGHGLISRTARLFNNPSFSDMKIHVKEDVGHKTFHTHKLLLSMAGDKFSTMYYGQSNVPSVLKISNYTPRIVHIVLWYIYCDELTVTSINEAADVLKFAQDYGITDLIKESMNYMGLSKLTADRVFSLYEIALNDNSTHLLTICQNFVCNETQKVFASEFFCEISLPVLQDILKQNSLSIKSEKDIINAVIRWCKYDCKKKGRPYEGLCIRESISPLLPFLRFLSLTAEEFCDFLEENNIFTSYESSILTRKIVQPSSAIRIPREFCSISKPRTPSANLNYNFRSYNTVTDLESKRPEQNRLSGGLFVEQKTAQTHNQSFSMVPKVPLSIYSFQPNNYDNLPSNTDTDEKTTALSTAVVKTQSRYSLQVNGHFSHQMPENTELQHAKHDVLHNQFGRANKSPVLKVMPQPKNIVSGQRFFDFPLEDMQKGIGAVRDRDLKCSAGIRMIKGMLIIHGVDLKVMSLPHCINENIDVYLRISGKFPVKDNVFPGKLTNSTLSIIFPEPLKLNQSSFAEIEVTIEDLKLNRCSICRDDKVELNNSSTTAAEISLKSNQSNENEGIFFLISRLIYSQS